MKLCVSILGALMLFAQTGSRWLLPLTIEVRQDVAVRASEGSHGQERGVLYASQAFQIKKGQRFQMIKIYTEGECRVRFQQREHDLHSCPWLDGFADHQSDIFRVIRTQDRSLGKD